MFAHWSLLRPRGVKKVSNGWSGINFHYWEPHQAKLAYIKFKTQVTRGVQNIQICVRTPCKIVQRHIRRKLNGLYLSELVEVPVGFLLLTSAFSAFSAFADWVSCPPLLDRDELALKACFIASFFSAPDGWLVCLIDLQEIKNVVVKLIREQ